MAGKPTVPGIRPHRLLCVAVAIAHLFVAEIGLAQPLNTWCPVMTEEPVDPEITTVYEGRTIAFCCGRCVEKFEANPTRYLANLAISADTNEESRESGRSVVKGPLLGRLHPAIIHFPLAGIPLALIAFAVWQFSGRDAFARADCIPLCVGTAASVLAVITGNMAEEASDFSGPLHDIVERHQFVSTLVMVLLILLLVLRVWRWNRLSGAWRRVYGTGLLVSCGLLAFTGYLGGSLVFGPDHFSW